MQRLCIIRDSFFKKTMTKQLLLHEHFNSSHTHFFQISTCIANPRSDRLHQLNHSPFSFKLFSPLALTVDIQPIHKVYYSKLLNGEGSVRTKILKTINYSEMKNQLKLEEEQAVRSGKVLDEKSILQFHFNFRVNAIIQERCDEAIAELDEEGKKQLELMKLELDFLYNDGEQVLSPSEMKSEEWLEILSIKSRAKRLKTFTYFFKKAMTKKNDKSKKEEKALRMSKEKKLIEESGGSPQQGFAYEHGKLFQHIYEREILKRSNSRLATEMLFGTPLVFDFDYLEYMRPQDIKNTAKQMADVYNLNRSQVNPFHLHFVNCPEDNDVFKHLVHQLSNLKHFMATVTGKSYLELFDNKNLVYLSPHAKQTLTEVNPHKVYIIGGFNDKGFPKKVSYARAKEQGITCEKLPLDQYLNWGKGNKSLTLDCMMKIMNTYQITEQWEQAFKHIPNRLLYRDTN